MKRTIIITCACVTIVLAAVCPATAQAPHIRIYFDEACTVDAMDCPGMGIIDTLYVVAEDFDAWIAAIEYEIDLPPELIFLGDLTSFQVLLGDSPNGIAMGFDPLFGGEPLLIDRIVVMYNCTSDCPVTNIPIRATPNSWSGHMRAVRWPDMAYVEAVIDSTLGKGTYLCPGPPVDCTVYPSSVDFDSVFVGSSKDTTFTIKNTGTEALADTVSESCAHYSIISGGGPYSIPPGDSLVVGVRFEPTAGGAHVCNIETGSAACDDVSLSGYGELVPVCEVAPTAIDFGSIYVGSFRDTMFVIRNTGGGMVDGVAGETCAHYSIVSDSAYSLAAGESLLVTVRFSPSSPGTHACTIETGTGLCDSVYCIGDAVEPPACWVWPDTLDFGSVPVGNSVALSFTIRNTGGSVLEGDVSESCAHFRIDSDSAYSLAAGESLVVTVRYEPASEGSHGCSIETGPVICSDVYAIGQSSPDPHITSIVDVGNDQGRFVRIYFDRSSRDIAGSPTPILQYEAFRRDDPLPVASRGGAAMATDTQGPRMRSDPSILAAGWEFAGAIPAHAEPEYLMIAPTLADSTISGGIHWSVFFIRAATGDPATFFDSPVDSGYSLDNLAPGVPQGFVVAYNAPGGNQLSWEPSGDVDFRYFKVYRSSDPDFTPAPQHLIHSTAEPAWTDPAGEGWSYSYRVTAVDFSGNESDPALAQAITVADGDAAVPGAYALRQCVPNPFNPTTTIQYGVPAGGGEVALRVYDVSGRRVRTLVDGRQTAGWKTTSWDATDAQGRRVASGVYFYRMTARGFAETRKMVLLQ